MDFEKFKAAYPVEHTIDSDPMILAQVFDRISLPTFVISSDNTILYWNRALESLSGLKRDEMVGTSEQWKPFYSSPRPCLADLIVEGGHDSDVERYYTGKYRTSELIPDAYEAEDFFPECGENGEWLHFTAASLQNHKGKVIGAIETLTNISARKKAELELIERERTYQQLSITDALTGLKNARHFHNQIEMALEKSDRYNQSFSLCFLDLDNFKYMNDTYGHITGDGILKTFAGLLKDGLRLNDSAYRYGGDEFSIILPSTDYSGAINLANRIREKVNNHNFSVSGDVSLNITSSIGVTEYKAGDNAKTILSRADAALYAAKRVGKNRISFRF